MRKIYVLCLLFFCSLTSVSAQVNRYQFTQTNGTYASIAGTTAIASGWDDNVSAAATTAIPFTFTINGTGYTSCRVSSNGYIAFGATPGTTNYTPISGNIGYNATISAFGRDLTDAATPAAITQTTLGISPSRIYVVQWNSARRYNGGIVTGDVLNFQIRMYETSNKAEIVYGACSATSTTALNAEVGLRGSANTDYSNRSQTIAWGTTSLGQSNVAIMSSSNTLMPASGLTYTWTPASCAIPTTITVPAGTITSNSAVINWTAASPTPGSGYEWKIVNPNSGSEVAALFTGTVGAGILTATATGLSASTPYAAYVRSNCSPTNSSWNGPVNFTTASTTPTITVSGTTLTVAGYNQGFGPLTPATSTFTTSGINLTANLTLTAPQRITKFPLLHLPDSETR